MFYGYGYDDDDVVMTPADEHREWHRLNGPPESTVCPWDCYDPPEPDRCRYCEEYLPDVGGCVNADADWHIQRVVDATRLQDDLVPSAPAPETDPWF